jgi:hypothetical protein
MYKNRFSYLSGCPKLQYAYKCGQNIVLQLISRSCDSNVQNHESAHRALHGSGRRWAGCEPQQVLNES